MKPAKFNNQIYYQKVFINLGIFIMLHVYIVMFKKNFKFVSIRFQNSLNVNFFMEES